MPLHLQMLFTSMIPMYTLRWLRLSACLYNIFDIIAQPPFAWEVYNILLAEHAGL